MVTTGIRGITALDDIDRIRARNVTEADHDVVAGVGVVDEDLAVQDTLDGIYRSSESESAVAVTERCPKPSVVKP